MAVHDTSTQKFSLHGIAVELQLSEPSLEVQTERLLGVFRTEQLPEGFQPAHGVIQPYDQAQVMKHLSSSAVRITKEREPVEMYQDRDKIWLIDDRWGMVQMDFKALSWRSWIVPAPTVSTTRCTEMAIVWPLAQLLRARGLYLIPAASVVRDDWAVLMISPFGLEPELGALIQSGYKIVGQRWTALREEDGRLAMLHMPGQVERVAQPRLRSTSEVPTIPSSSWIDLSDEHPNTVQHHAFADAVLVAEPGRRTESHLREMGYTAAVNIMRRNWPIAELHPRRRQPQLPTRLAQYCRCCELQLSRDPNELATMLTTLRNSPATRRINPLPVAPEKFRSRPPRRIAG